MTFSSLLTFAAESTKAAYDHTESTGGIAALGIDLKAFIFQLVTFILVLLFLRKFAFGKLVATLEERREAVIGSLEAAKQAAADLEKSEANVTALLAEARKEATEIVATAHKEAAVMIEEAEAKAHKKAEHIVLEAHAQLDTEVLKAKAALQKEVKLLVAQATEKIISQKLTSAADEQLISDAIAGVKR